MSLLTDTLRHYGVKGMKWGVRKDRDSGLTHMELDLTEESIRHANLSEDEELELAFEQTFPQLTESQEELVFGNSDNIEYSSDLELSHYGVKGMRWGVRNDRTNRGTKDRNKSESNSNTQTQKPKITGQSARSRMKPLDQMTDEELVKLVARMDNEIRYNANASKLYYSRQEKRAMDTSKFLRDQGRNSAVMVKDKALREGLEFIFNASKRK